MWPFRSKNEKIVRLKAEIQVLEGKIKRLAQRHEVFRSLQEKLATKKDGKNSPLWKNADVNIRKARMDFLNLQKICLRKEQKLNKLTQNQ